MPHQSLLESLIRKLFSLLFVVGVLWVVFAYFEMHFQSNLFKGYYVRNAISFPYTITYRIEPDHVVSKTGAFINKYENCAIFDAKNWSCTYSDNSATFGAKDGIYFNRSNTIDFPHLAQYGDDEGISRFKFMLLSCTNSGILACIAGPFFI